MSLQQHGNMLAIYPLLLERVAAVQGVKAVKEAGELAMLLSGIKEKRSVLPLSGAVYVVYGGHRAASDVARGKVQRNTLYFSLVYCADYRHSHAANLHQVGKVLTDLKHALQGWDAGREVAASAFREIDPPAIEYNDGFAFYPLSFTVDVVVA